MVFGLTLAGCMSASESRFRVPSVSVENRDGTAHNVSFELVAGDKTVLAKSTELDSAATEPTGKTWELDEEKMTRPVQLRYRIDDGDWKEDQLAERADTCIRPEIEISPGGNPTVVYFQCY